MARAHDNRLTVVISRPVDYFEVGVFAICFIYGVLALARWDLAAMSLKLFPWSGGVVFLSALVAGGATGLISYGFKTIMGPRLELAGLTLLVSFCLAYTVWTPIVLGERGIGLVLFMGLLIWIPGLFERKRLKKYITRLESIEGNSTTSQKESGKRAADTSPMGHRNPGHRRNR